MQTAPRQSQGVDELKEGGWQPLDELAMTGCRTLFVREKGAVFSAPGNPAHNLIRMARGPSLMSEQARGAPFMRSISGVFLLAVLPIPESASSHHSNTSKLY